MAKKKKEKKESEEKFSYSGLSKGQSEYLEERKALKIIRRERESYEKEKGLEKKEGIEQKFSSVAKRFLKTGTTAYKPSVRERRISQIARKAVSLAAPKGSMIKAITTTTKKKGSRGRGRPSGTYKVRYLPSGKAVKVPTHIYKKMLSAEKSQMRLAQAQQMAQQADQLAMQQDMRYQPSAEDQFLAEPDQQHEMDVMVAQQQADIQQAEQQYQQQYQQQAPSVGQRIVRGFRNLGKREYGPEELRQPPPIHRPIIQSFQRPQPRGMEPRIEPRVTAVSGKANLLRASSNFQSNPEQSMLTPHKELNFFSNKQPIRVPDRSKSFKIMQSQNNR